MPVVTSSTGNDRATPGPLSQVSGYADTVVNLGVGGAVITASAFLLLVSVFSRASRTLDNSNVLPRSKQKATWILDVLKQQQLVPAQVSVLRAEPGVGSPLRAEAGTQNLRYSKITKLIYPYMIWTAP